MKDEGPGTGPPQPTTLGLSRGDRLVLKIGAPTLGLLLGLLLRPVADWASDHRWPVFGGPLRLIASWEAAWVPIALAAAGAALGAAFAAVSFAETLVLTLTAAELRLGKQGATTTIDRGSATAVFLDGKQLVILGRRSEELVRAGHDSAPAALVAAFGEHGWPWFDADPHAGQYRRWVPDLPEIPAAVHALLAARDRALRRDDSAEVADLRSELGRLGYVVRDESQRQWWRALLPPEGAAGRG